MSIDYSLEFATGTPAARVAEELSRIAETAGVLDRSAASEREPEAPITAERLLDGVVLRGGLWVRVLHRDLEIAWLLRRAGEVSLHERDDLWTSERLAMVGARPHRRSTWSFE